jgi:hypothetical protein
MTEKYAGHEPIAQPTTVATFGSWVTLITRPADGEAVTALSVTVALDGLAARTNWLAHRTIDIRAGGAYDNAPIQFNGLFLLYGPTVVSNLEFTGGSWPKLSPARTWERHSLRILTSTRSDSADPSAGVPDAWPTIVDGGAVIETRSTNELTKEHWVALDGLPDGGAITSIEVKLKGADGGASTMNFPSYRPARFRGTGAIEYLAVEALDDHVWADWATTKTKTITVTDNEIVDKDYSYVLIIKHANNGVPSGRAYVLDVAVYGTSDRMGL